MYKISFILLVLIVLSFTDLFSVETKEWAVALNLSGRQRMLSQKMAKEFLLTKLDIDKKKNDALLKKTMTMFEKTLDQLIAGDKDLSIPKAPNKEILAQLNKVKNLWQGYKGALLKKELLKVASLNLPVLTNMNKAVGMYEKASIKDGVKESGPIINVAGRQRMLLQKMSKEVFLIALNVDKMKNLKTLEGTKNLFNKSLYGLKDGNKKMNLPGTKNKRTLKQIQKVEKLWLPFKKDIEKVIKTKKTEKDLINSIFKKNPILLKEMNRAVKLYEVSAI